MLLLPIILSAAAVSALPNKYGSVVLRNNRRQTADDIITALNELSVSIPNDCVADCQTFLTSYTTCGTTAATAATCVCTTQFITDLTTCTTCMTNSFTTSGDTANLALPANDLATVNAACAAVASTTLGATSSTSTTASTSTTSIPSTTSSTTTSSSSATSSVTSSSSSSSSTSSIQTGDVTITSVVAGSPFPSQTKSANVFSAGERVAVNAGFGLGVGVIAGAAGWLVFL